MSDSTSSGSASKHQAADRGLRDALAAAHDSAAVTLIELAYLRAWQAERLEVDAVAARAHPALAVVTSELEQAAGDDRPVLLVADETAAALAAALLHRGGPGRPGPLIVVRTDAEPDPAAALLGSAAAPGLLGAAAGGTLYLARADAAPASLVAALPRLMSGGARLVASCAPAGDGALPSAMRAAGAVTIRLGTERRENGAPPLRELLDAYERRIIAGALALHGGSRTRAADALGITREGLHKKLIKLGVSR